MSNNRLRWSLGGHVTSILYVLHVSLITHQFLIDTKMSIHNSITLVFTNALNQTILQLSQIHAPPKHKDYGTKCLPQIDEAIEKS